MIECYLKLITGSIYRSIHKSAKKNVVIKATNINLHSQSVAIIDAKHYKVNENILKEIAILKHLTDDQNCPKSIVKYVESFKGSVNFKSVYHSSHLLTFFCL